METRDWIELDLCGFLCGRSEEECCKGTIGRLGGGIMVALRFVRMLGIVDPP